MNQTKSTICKNCGNHFDGNYCNSCGQHGETHRITWHELAHHLPHALFHADKGLYYSIKELIVRPGLTIRDYIAGKRVYHFNPLLFLILIGSLASFLFSFLHINPPNEEIALVKIESFNATIAHKYFALVGLFFIILLTITDFLFYPNKKFIIPEIIISNTFQAGQIMVFTIAMLPLFFLQNYYLKEYGGNIEIRLLLKAISVGFLFFTRYQLYEAKGNNQLIVKIAVQIILVYLLYNQGITRMIVYFQG
jgi:cellulose synthase/poly-beta-1,6-N-acetylglucosamine synthase-like glycosyltransferase